MSPRTGKLLGNLIPLAVLAAAAAVVVGALDDVMRRVVDHHARLLVQTGDLLPQELGSPTA
ncbi:MAG TPA: hypothetical protein VIA06_24645 [Candidatus Dormibacteraeota bacterium]|jgi:hypothetical protein|nr:hypothetical protein [Candidatus Dormibacteraeota bacterium]